MRQDEWARQVVALIAESVKRCREERKLSAQKLADRCGELGYPALTRSVITNLETGVRDSLTVPEWLALAQALKVPALLLLFPLGRVPTIELLPDVEMSPWEALQWANDGETEHDKPRDGVIAWFGQHDAALRAWHRADREVAGADRALADDRIDPEITRRLREARTNDRERAEEHLQTIRSLIKHNGLTPPELPPALRHLDPDASP